MSAGEIEAVIDGFVQAARRACLAGFDGVELFAAYNALIDQFWSPLTNRRTDRWGGALANRLRFAVRIVEGIRALVGQDFVVGMAISGAEPIPAGCRSPTRARSAPGSMSAGWSTISRWAPAAISITSSGSSPRS